MTLPSNSKEDCTKECLNNETCFSINLYMVSGQGTCELLQSNAFVNKSLLSDERIGWTHISFDVSDIELLRNRILIFMQLTHFMPLVSFYTFWKHQKTKGFLVFSGGIEREQWHEMGWTDFNFPFSFPRSFSVWLILRSLSNNLPISTGYIFTIVNHLRFLLYNISSYFEHYGQDSLIVT